MTGRIPLAIALGAGALAALGHGAIQAAAPDRPPASATPPRTGFFDTAGYLAPAAMPDSLVINPPPPAAGTAAEARDLEAARAALALRGTPRWDLARRDADVFTPAATAAFSCAVGVSISAGTTPRLDLLLRRVGRDFAGSTSPTKRRYQRPRPFMVNRQPTCTPDHDAMLVRDGSYPSGHSALGYGWGLVLAQVAPDRAARLVARGRAFGESRRICNVHWLSDIEEGRAVATAVFARLQAEPDFIADAAAARTEVAALRAKAPAPDCAAETAGFAGG